MRRRRSPAAPVPFVERRVERVGPDVGDGDRDPADEVDERQAAEGPLVDEPQLRAAVRERQPDPQVGLVLLPVLADQQLAAHAEVGKDGVLTPVEGQPQVLAAAVRRGQGAAGEPGREVGATGHVPANGARVEDLDGGHRAPRDPPLEPPADDLDLGQLRHARP